jgi:hypothetical protein
MLLVELENDIKLFRVPEQFTIYRAISFKDGFPVQPPYMTTIKQLIDKFHSDNFVGQRYVFIFHLKGVGR